MLFLFERLAWQIPQMCVEGSHKSVSQYCIKELACFLQPVPQ
ncbi:MAG: hypothetical protein AB7G17_00935 [Phycisphaerales bacterium]